MRDLWPEYTLTGRDSVTCACELRVCVCAGMRMWGRTLNFDARLYTYIHFNTQHREELSRRPVTGNKPIELQSEKNAERTGCEYFLAAEKEWERHDCKTAASSAADRVIRGPTSSLQETRYAVSRSRYVDFYIRQNV